MRGIAVFVVLSLAVTAFAQGPSTRTKKGPRPSRRGDNTDRGLPSGKDVPDGRRFPLGGAAPPPPAGAPPARGVAPPPPGAGAPPPPVRVAAPPPPARVAAPPPPAGVGAPPPPAMGGAPPPPAMGGAPPPARPMGRLGDNTDVGLPSGNDVPDGRRMPMTRTRSGPPPVRRLPPVYNVPAPAAPVAPAAPMVPVRQPVMFNPWAPVAAPAPLAPAAPALSCEAQCPYFWQPVCSVYGNSYDNECRLRCSGEPYSCEGQCPCEEPKAAPAAPIVDPFMGFLDMGSCGCPVTYDPVCTESGDDKDNECLARCDGHIVNCSGRCPCS